MFKQAIAFVVLSSCFLGGCANMTSPARMHELDPTKAYWFDYDASRRGALYVPGGTKIATCAEPSPDVGLNFAEQILGEVKTTLGNGPVDATVQAQLNSSIVELAGRTETITFLRESMFRLCEQSINGNLKPADVKALYELVVTTALKLAEADLAKHQAELAKALQDPHVRAIWNQMHAAQPTSK